MGKQRFDSFTTTYKHCKQYHNTHANNYYGEPDTNKLRAKDNKFKLNIHKELIIKEDQHELACMLPNRLLKEEDINILNCQDINVNYDQAPHVKQYTNNSILNNNYQKQRKAGNRLSLNIDYQLLKARDSLNQDQRLVYNTVINHFLNQEPSQLLLYMDSGGGTRKLYLINLLFIYL